MVTRGGSERCFIEFCIASQFIDTSQYISYQPQLPIRLRVSEAASPNTAKRKSPQTLSSNPAELKTSQATQALAMAPTTTSASAWPYPQSIRISKAATLFTMTAQLTADAADGKSYSHTMSKIGNSLVHELTMRAVDSEFAFW